MQNMPARFYNNWNIDVPTSDHRYHSDSHRGVLYHIGTGFVYHDLVNVPFFGYVYDSATIAHPLRPVDCHMYRGTEPEHYAMLLSLLQEIQCQALGDAESTPQELQARQESIEMLASAKRFARGRMVAQWGQMRAAKVAVGNADVNVHHAT